MAKKTRRRTKRRWLLTRRESTPYNNSHTFWRREGKNGSGKNKRKRGGAERRLRRHRIQWSSAGASCVLSSPLQNAAAAQRSSWAVCVCGSFEGRHHHHHRSQTLSELNQRGKLKEKSYMCPRDAATAAKTHGGSDRCLPPICRSRAFRGSGNGHWWTVLWRRKRRVICTQTVELFEALTHPPLPCNKPEDSYCYRYCLTVVGKLEFLDFFLPCSCIQLFVRRMLGICQNISSHVLVLDSTTNKKCCLTYSVILLELVLCKNSYSLKENSGFSSMCGEHPGCNWITYVNTIFHYSNYVSETHLVNPETTSPRKIRVHHHKTQCFPLSSSKEMLISGSESQETFFKETWK